MVKATAALAPLALWASSAVGKEIQPDAERGVRLYDSGIIHNELMSRKMVSFYHVTCLGC